MIIINIFITVMYFIVLLFPYKKGNSGAQKKIGIVLIMDKVKER